ncbi:lasso peptide biosynthesis B2 protein [Brevundimonas pondensis]|uniref:lasso peptide biosynthesis B2 protein n=1 Tax=Brevundimonas pondensis TaxID=2774189 RepID=UPI0015FFE1F3
MQTATPHSFRHQLERGELAQTVRAAKVGSDLILLDLATDGYLLVPNCDDVRIEGGTVEAPMDLMLELAASELLQSGQARHLRPPPPPIPLLRLPEAPVSKPSVADMAAFAVLWADTVRRKPTIQTLARQFADRQGRRDDLAAISARVALFRQMLPCAPAVGACLFQAELLLRFLNAADLDAEWVFGVRVWPFLAHCWLQVGEHCVSQAPDTLAIYRPIMAI